MAFIEVVRLPGTFPAQEHEAGNDVGHGRSAAAESPHRWLALTELPPCRPPGEQILLCAEKGANSLLIFIVGKSLSSPPTGKCLSVLMVYITGAIYFTEKNSLVTRCLSLSEPRDSFILEKKRERTCKQ